MSTLRDIDDQIACLQIERVKALAEAVRLIADALPAFSPSRHEIEDLAREICEDPYPLLTLFLDYLTSK